MENKEECICNIKFESVYIERKDNSVVKMTFRNMIWHQDFKSKIDLIWSWIRNNEKLSFKQFLDKPRELTTEFIHIELFSKNDL